MPPALAVAAKPVIPPVRIAGVRGTVLESNLGAIALTFDGAVDAGSAGDRGSYLLVSPGKDRKLGTKDDKAVALKSASQDSTSRATTLVPNAKLAAATGARLTIRVSLKDSLGRPDRWRPRRSTGR